MVDFFRILASLVLSVTLGLSPICAWGGEEDYIRAAEEQARKEELGRLKKDQARGIQDSAKQAEKQQRRAFLLNMMIGASMFVYGSQMRSKGFLSGSSPLMNMGMTMMVMGLMTLQTGRGMAKSSGVAGQTAGMVAKESPAGEPQMNEIQGNMGLLGADGSKVPNDLAQIPGAEATLSSASQSIKDLQKAGFQVDQENAKITTPDGKVIDADDLSVAGMAANGLSPEMQSRLKLEMDGIVAAQKEKVGDVDESLIAAAKPEFVTGGRGMPAPTTTSIEESDSAITSRKPLKASGLSKIFGDSRIGVSGDSIFMIIKERYKKVYAQDKLIPESPADIKSAQPRR